jgi:hypothetical protein
MMGFGTVLPEMVIGFAETVTHAVEVGEAEDWQDEDLAPIIAACREVGQKFESMEEKLRQSLLHGVDVATFVARSEPPLLRLERLLVEQARIQAEMGRSSEGSSVEAPELVAEFTAMGQAVGRFRDLLKNAISAMKAPRHLIDGKRFQEAQAAYLRGETQPFQSAPEPSGK